MKRYSVSSLLIISVLIVAGVFGYLLYRNHTLNSSTTPTPTPTSQATPTPTSSTTVSNGVLKIPDLGIQITVSSSLNDLYYKTSSQNQHVYAGFSTHSLVAAGGSTCDVDFAHYGPPLGIIFVSSSPPTVNATVTVDGLLGTLVKQLGSTYVYYQSPQDVCTVSISNPADTLQATQIKEFKTALQSITLLP